MTLGDLLGLDYVARRPVGAHGPDVAQGLDAGLQRDYVLPLGWPFDPGVLGCDLEGLRDPILVGPA